jgi:hypothetical protein
MWRSFLEFGNFFATRKLFAPGHRQSGVIEDF